MTLWSTALARDVGGSKIPAERLGTNLRAHTRARARLPGEFPLRKHPWNPVFVDEEGYPHFVLRSNQTLVVLAAEQVVSLSR